jgi:hypothetical protein
MTAVGIDHAALGRPPRRDLRLALAGTLSVLAGIGTSPCWQKGGFVVVCALVLGTWRRARVTEKSLLTCWTVGFFHLPHTSARLRQFTHIEIVHEPPVGVWEFLLFGPLGSLWAFVGERLFPGLSGSDQLWLNNEADDRHLAWQGHRQTDFETVLERLKLATGLPARVR